MKVNCWEFKKCELEPGGKKAKEKGVCPAAVEKKTNGIHGGKNGGRCCWVIEGTLCEEGFAKKFAACTECDFYGLVTGEETNILPILDIQNKIKN